MSKKLFVGVSAARQGGFSSHVLPAPVEFDPVPAFPHYRLAPDITLNEQETAIVSATLNRDQPTIDWILDQKQIPQQIQSSYRQQNFDDTIIRLESGGPGGTNALESPAPVISSSFSFDETYTITHATDSDVPFGNLKGFTLEAIIRMIDFFPVINTTFEEVITRVEITLWRLDAPLQYASIFIRLDASRDSNFIGVDSYSFNRGYFLNETIGAGDPLPFTVDDWVHFAVCQDGEQGFVYINGQRVDDFTFDDFTFGDYTENNPDFAPLTLLVNTNSYHFVEQNINPTPVPRVHGVRFTPRALYTGASFTPPANITDFA